MASLVAAACAAVALAGSPEQIHLAIADSTDTHISVSWFTSDAATNASVCWAAEGGAACSAGTAPATSVQYLPSGGWHHHAYMTGLVPGKRFTYAVGEGPSGPWSDDVTFTAPSAAPNASYGVSVYGDMGWLGSAERPDVVHAGGLVKNWSAVGTRATIERLKDEGEIDFVWHLGDIAYADDAYDANPFKFEYENVYNGFVNWFHNVSSIMPYMVSPGNHESECHSPACVIKSNDLADHLRNFSAFNARWRMPSSASGGVLNMWYSFDKGPVHWVSVNSETDFPGAAEENTGDSGDKKLPAGHFGRDGEYLAWLEADLAKAHANRAERPWIIAGGHRPFREIAGNGVAEMFAKYGVDLYFCGHTHSYSRSLPVCNGVVDPQPSTSHYHAANGTTLIVVGGAGCDEMTDRLDVGLDTPTITQVVATDKVASGVLRVVNGSALHWQLLYSRTGEVLDDLWLTK